MAGIGQPKKALFQNWKALGFLTHARQVPCAEV
jgi:hypothetical protein